MLNFSETSSILILITVCLKSISVFTSFSAKACITTENVILLTSLYFVLASSLAFICCKLNKTFQCRRINIFGRNKVTILTARPSISLWRWKFQKRLCCILPDITLVVSSFDMFCQLWFSWWQVITDKLFLGKYIFSHFSCTLVRSFSHV